MSDENPWAKAKERNAIYQRLMAAHPLKQDRTPEEAASWDADIALYEESLGCTLVRQHDGSVAIPFRKQG